MLRLQLSLLVIPTLARMEVSACPQRKLPIRPTLAPSSSAHAQTASLDCVVNYVSLTDFFFLNLPFEHYKDNFCSPKM